MEVACNLAPFGAASNNNLNPIMESGVEDHEENNVKVIVDDNDAIVKSASDIEENQQSCAKVVQNGNQETNGNVQQNR